MKSRKPKPDYRRIAAAALAIMIALVMVLGMLSPLFASPLADAAITDGQIGYNRMYRMGGYTPFRVSLANSGEAAFEGTLRIMVDVAQVQSERNFVSYSSEVFLPAGSTQDVELVIPLSAFRRTHRAVLADSAGRIVSSRTMFASSVDTHTAMAAIFTGYHSTQGASRLRWLQLDDRGFGHFPILNERLIFLDESTFPSSLQTMNNFNMIVLDAVNVVERLSEAQLDALYKWVYEGGALVVSGSTGYGLDITPSQTDLDFRGEFSVSLPNEGQLAYVPQPESLGEARELTHIFPFGSGTVFVHMFSLTGEPFTTFEGGIDFLSEIYRTAITPGSPQRGLTFHEMIRLTNNLPSFNDTQLTVILAIVGLYALILGSVLYIVLKKRDKREAAIYVIPAAALGVTAVIAVIGLGSSYQAPITNTVMRLVLENGTGLAAAESFTGVHTPASGDIVVTLANDAAIRFESIPPWHIMPRGNLLSSFMPAMPVPPHNHPVRITERNEAEIPIDGYPRITYFNRASWNGNHFSQNTEVELEGALDGEFHFDENVLVGRLRNNTGLDLHDVIVTIGSATERHDFLANGDTLDFRKYLGSAPPHFSPWNILDDAFPFHGLGHGLSPEEGRNLQFRREVLSTMIMGGLGNAMFSTSGKRGVVVAPGRAVAVPSPASAVTPPAVEYPYDEYPGYEPSARPITRREAIAPIIVRVMAYNFDDVTGMGINVGGTPAKSIHTNFVVAGLPAGLGSSSSFDLPMGIIGFTAIESNVNFDHHDFSNEFHVQDSGFINFIYNFDARIDILQVSWESPMHAAGMYKFIYNHYTGEWENIRPEYNDDIGDYIYNGELRLRAEFQPFNWISAPRIRIVGGN